jgi:probable phosphoglycerate mutase
VIVLVRHARVWNPEHVVYARLRGFHLSKEGRADAEALATKLSDAPVAAVYSSPLERAVETAEILAGRHAIGVATDDSLMEWSFWAHWQGMPWEPIRERDPHLLERYGRDPSSIWPQDPLEAVSRRILRFADRVDREHGTVGSDRVVLAVSHEAPVIAAMLVAQGKSLDGFHAVNLPHLALVRIRPEPAALVEAKDLTAEVPVVPVALESTEGPR